MNSGLKDAIKAFTFLGALISIKALIDSQRERINKHDYTEEDHFTLVRIERALKSKGIIG
jgi:hypothetical protein